MANVFGNPITDSTLAAMPEYANKQPTAVDRARVALNMQSIGTKATDALIFVQNLKKQYGDGVSTLCLLYNATGNTLTFVTPKDWYGHIGQAPYPMRIQNGQWGAFLHVQSSAEANGSCAAPVFRGKKSNGVDCDYMMAWRNPGNEAKFDNSVCIEARAVNHFNTWWGVIYGYLEQSRYNYSDSWEGCLTTIATGSGTSPVVKAVFTLEDAANA